MRSSGRGWKRTRSSLSRPSLSFRFRAVLFVFILLIVPVLVQVSAETRVQTEINTLAVLGWTGDEVGLAGISQGIVDFRSAGDRNVQARLQLRFTVDQLEVPRSSIRFRFPVTEDYTVRVTAGRDRVSWGLGSLFNAADLVFGADGRDTADLMQTEDVRDETIWLASFYVPLGALGYVETVALPPVPDLAWTSVTTDDNQAADEGGVAEDCSTSSNGVLSARDARLGIRLHNVAGPLSVEPAWLYDGDAGVHRLALALQGSLGADIYGAASLHLPDEGPSDARNKPAQIIEDYSLFSVGAFHIFSLERDHSLSVRMEALVRPGGAWTDRGDPGTASALYLYPELVWGAGRTVQMIGRGMVSPLDLSAEITTGVSWNIFQGFFALAFATVQAGEDSDVYGWDRPGSAGLSLGFRYLF